MGRHLWMDVAAGVAGDMLLAALHDAGASLDAVRRAVDAVIPGSVEITARPVTRAGLRALKVDVTPLSEDPPHRTWRSIRSLLQDADLPLGVRSSALNVFAKLAEVEAVAHSVDPEDVHFHEVGALDSIADIIGVCAALDDLKVTTVSASEVALGSGRVRTSHGELPVPAPAVAELSRGWRVRAGGTGELATPTGMALVRTLATTCEDLPTMTVAAVGAGAGTRDTPERPNVVRVLLGSPQLVVHLPSPALLLEANIDDHDPRLWPGVLQALLDAGADDAWLVPILMKKGRPAHTLTVLCSPESAPALRTVMFRETSTLGVRESPRAKTALSRDFAKVDVAGHPVPVKIGYRDGVIVQATPEFEDVAALARDLARPPREILRDATTAADAAGLTPGAPWPPQR